MTEKYLLNVPSIGIGITTVGYLELRWGYARWCLLAL